MSYENAKANLKEFGKELNLEGLDFDANNTCILGIDNTFSLHLTYEPNSDRLYLYSPLLDGLPKDQKILLKLYERLLEGSMLGGQMAGGGVGVAVKEELILLHCYIEMGVGTDASALRRFAPLFVEVVEKWRDIVGKICAGQEPEPFTLPLPGGKQMPIDKKKPSAPGGPGEYIKI
ncbi:MAG: CesT family type III secretion system chaperone [Parachlamydiales bacterium]|nr:CesT family type III secretion system chaperone [Parachlamydiales bacterium]